LKIDDEKDNNKNNGKNSDKNSGKNSDKINGKNSDKCKIRISCGLFEHCKN